MTHKKRKVRKKYDCRAHHILELRLIQIFEITFILCPLSLRIVTKPNVLVYRFFSIKFLAVCWMIHICYTFKLAVNDGYADIWLGLSVLVRCFSTTGYQRGFSALRHWSFVWILQLYWGDEQLSFQSVPTFGVWMMVAGDPNTWLKECYMSFFSSLASSNMQ